MTNYDVIEAYVEDFTNWNYVKARGVATISQHKFIITECILKGLSIVEDIQEPYSNLTVRITGVTENRYLIVRQGRGKPETHIKKDGVYTFKDNNLYFGFGVSVIGECNITITQLPTSILKDYSGNGNHAYLYGGKGRLNSGVGIYAQDFTKWIFGSAIHNISTKAHNKLHIVKKNPNNYFGFTVGIQKANYYNKPYKLKFNFNKEINDIKFSVVSTDGNLIATQCFSAIINNGYVVDVPIISEEIFNNQKEPNIYYDFGTNKDIKIDVELIPDYPNQLCYDGKMYAIAYGMPILTDYTIIADRTWFKDKINSWSYFADKKKAFTFERTSNGKSFNAMSFAAETAIELQKDGVSYQTKASYNGNAINYHSDQADNDDRLVIGSTKDSLGNQCFIGCHSDILIFNRTLTEYEISWVKNNMMCSKQQEHDIDL
jgi:hypothetical protein